MGGYKIDYYSHPYQQLCGFIESHCGVCFCRNANRVTTAEIPTAHFDLSIHWSVRLFFFVFEFCDSIQRGVKLANPIRAEFHAYANIHNRAMYKCAQFYFFYLFPTNFKQFEAPK
jgi:hypothetical protein